MSVVFATISKNLYSYFELENRPEGKTKMIANDVMFKHVHVRNWGRVGASVPRIVLDAAAIILSLLLPGFALATPPNYAITDLGTLGGTRSEAYGLNESGQVVGRAWTAGNTAYHAFIYSDGILTDLGTLGGTNSIAYDINNSAQVAGWAQSGLGNQRRAFLHDNGSMMALPELGTLAGYDSEAFGLNDNGQVVGHGIAGRWFEPYRSAFLFEQGVTTNLLTGCCGQANAVNVHGEIAGTSNGYAWLSSGGTMIGLGSLGGPGSYAKGINAAGQVVGGSAYMPGNPASHPFLYEAGVMTDLGGLGGSYGEATAINDLGDVVGWSQTNGDSAAHAFLRYAGLLHDLNSYVDPDTGWVLNQAFDINNAGQIVGFGTFENQTRAFLLTPVPEPVTAALVLLGSIASRRRRGNPFSATSPTRS